MAAGQGELTSNLTKRSSSKSLLLQNVECGVCGDVFSLQGDRVPRLLHCGHTVCHQCLTRHRIQENNTLNCPFDRQPTHVGDSGVWGLKKNFALIELLEKLQLPAHTTEFGWSEDVLQRERELAIPCDENEQHAAVLYCKTCATHLCLECAESTHATRTLAKHCRVPLSEKPKEIPHCQYHAQHIVEFICLEDGCKASPLMCYICKDYGRHVKHKHSLLDVEADKVRQTIVKAVTHVRGFAEEIAESARRLNVAIQQIEGHTAPPADEAQRHTNTSGTAEDARQRVKQYFNDLADRLREQEISALSVVDTHIRERLLMLRQQQEDMSVVLSQISAVRFQCEKTLQQDDAKVMLARHEVQCLLDSVHDHKQNMAELPDQLQLDPNIPITFTKDNRVHIGPKMEMRVLTLGLDGAGKTSILFHLKQNEYIQTIPTIGFNVETIEYKNLKITIWDVGGQPKLRPLWKHYYLNTQALIYVVDGSNESRLAESYNELAKLIQEPELKEASLLVFANKQDVTGHVTIEELTQRFNLFKLCCSRSWHIQGCAASSGQGLLDGLEWLSHQLGPGPV